MLQGFGLLWECSELPEPWEQTRALHSAQNPWGAAQPLGGRATLSQESPSKGQTQGQRAAHFPLLLLPFSPCSSPFPSHSSPSPPAAPPGLAPVPRAEFLLGGAPCPLHDAGVCFSAVAASLLPLLLSSPSSPFSLCPPCWSLQTVVTQGVRAGDWSHQSHHGEGTAPPHPQQLHDELPVLLVLVPVFLLHLLHFTLQGETPAASEMTTSSRVLQPQMVTPRVLSSPVSQTLSEQLTSSQGTGSSELHVNPPPPSS